jgi:peroxiredoxin
MFRRTLFSLVLACGVGVLAPAAYAEALPGTAAPAFTLIDVNGKRVQLADFRGKYVVLEWNNPSCPFVQKHYNSGNMQALQKRFTDASVAWLTINSTAMSHSEFRQPADLAAWMKQRGGTPTALMLDPDGKVGHAYDARATPQMYVIDPKGTLIYAGAIDDKRGTSLDDVKTAKNYVVAALDDAMAGRPVVVAHTQAYGCSIKYSD